MPPISDPDPPITVFSLTVMEGPTNYSYDPAELNLLTSINGTTVNYDDHFGNITSRDDNGHRYVFNASDQLTEVYSNENLIGKYYYNSEGKR